MNISANFRKNLKRPLWDGARGKLTQEKNRKSKVSCQTPFKASIPWISLIRGQASTTGITYLVCSRLSLVRLPRAVMEWSLLATHLRLLAPRGEWVRHNFFFTAKKTRNFSTILPSRAILVFNNSITAPMVGSSYFFPPDLERTFGDTLLQSKQTLDTISLFVIFKFAQLRNVEN